MHANRYRTLYETGKTGCVAYAMLCKKHRGFT
jgi:hypothetical protein